MTLKFGGGMEVLHNKYLTGFTIYLIYRTLRFAEEVTVFLLI